MLRVIPGLADAIQLELIPKVDGKAAMQLDSHRGKVVLRGTGGVELASALNWYMNDYLNMTYDWSTYAEGQSPQLMGRGKAALASGTVVRVPLPSTRIVRHRKMPWSYYMNVCTYGEQSALRSAACLKMAFHLIHSGYSLAFVPWEYWSKHIDWMAMQEPTHLSSLAWP